MHIVRNNLIALTQERIGCLKFEVLFILENSQHLMKNVLLHYFTAAEFYEFSGP